MHTHTSLSHVRTHPRTRIHADTYNVLIEGCFTRIILEQACPHRPCPPLLKSAGRTHGCRDRPGVGRAPRSVCEEGSSAGASYGIGDSVCSMYARECGRCRCSGMSRAHFRRSRRSSDLDKLDDPIHADGLDNEPHWCSGLRMEGQRNLGSMEFQGHG